VLIEKEDENAPIPPNMPPIAGAISWTNGLMERIQDPMARLQGLSQSLQDREEYRDVVKLHQSLERQLQTDCIDSKVEICIKDIEENTKDQLNEFLLVREETEPDADFLVHNKPEPVLTGFIKVNFDPALDKSLREIKYLLL